MVLRRATFGLTVMALAALLVAGCSQKSGDTGPADCSTSAASPSSVSCKLGLYDNYFENKEIFVKSGTTVTFSDEGKNPHTATADDGSWTTDTLSPGQTGTHAFTAAGDVAIHCKFHQASGMVGTVHVVA